MNEIHINNLKLDLHNNGGGSIHNGVLRLQVWVFM